LSDNRTTRLFFALWPDPATRKRLAALQQEFSGHTGRFNHPQDLHITLVFLGPVEEARMNQVVEAAEQVSPAVFSLSIDRPVPAWLPRILWCGPSLTPPPLTRLVTTLEQALAGYGFPPEKRRYTPHVTLARKILPEERGENRPLAHAVHWPVKDFVLVGSGGQGPGPRYRVLKKWAADS